MQWDIFWECLKGQTPLQSEEGEPGRLSSIFEQKPEQPEEEVLRKKV
jgi:hypothetical protein